MNDTHLCFMAALVVTAYGIYMYFNPHTNGLVFGSVCAVIGALAGVHLQKRYGGPSEVYVNEETTTEDQEL